MCNSRHIGWNCSQHRARTARQSQEIPGSKKSGGTCDWKKANLFVLQHTPSRMLALLRKVPQFPPTQKMMRSEEEENGFCFWSHVLRAQSNHLEVLKFPKRDISYFREKSNYREMSNRNIHEELLTGMLFTLTFDCIPSIYRELQEEITSQNGTKIYMTLVETKGSGK